MTFSFALVLALFLFAPGFAAYAGLFFGTQSKTFRPAPPAPGSLLSLGLVTIGAILAHAAGALAFWLNDLAVANGLQLIGTRAEPNLYVAVLSASRGSLMLSGGQVFGLLAGLTVLSTAAFFAVAKIVRAEIARSNFAPLLYGWLADLVADAAPEDRYVTAFALTDTEHDGSFLGYEGVLENVTLTSDKEITSVLLSDCTRFRIKLTDEGLERTALRAGSTIPLLYLERAQIKNIAFNVYQLADPEEIQAAVAEGATPATADAGPANAAEPGS